MMGWFCNSTSTFIFLVHSSKRSRECRKTLIWSGDPCGSTPPPTMPTIWLFPPSLTGKISPSDPGDENWGDLLVAENNRLSVGHKHIHFRGNYPLPLCRRRSELHEVPVRGGHIHVRVVMLL